MTIQNIKDYLNEKKRCVINTFYLTAASILLLPQYALAASTKSKEDTPVNPYALVNKATSFVVCVASAFAFVVGIATLIGGIQKFSRARESHDTSTMMKAVGKVLSGALVALVGGVAAWLRSQAK